MTADKLTSAITDGHAENDGSVEDNQSAVLKRIEELLTNPKSRDLVMWENRGVDRALFSETFYSLSEKGFGLIGSSWWTAGLLAACDHQARTELQYRNTGEAAFNSLAAKQKSARDIPLSDLKAYAKNTRKKVDFEEARARRANGKTNGKTDQ